MTGKIMVNSGGKGLIQNEQLASATGRFGRLIARRAARLWVGTDRSVELSMNGSHRGSDPESCRTANGQKRSRMGKAGYRSALSHFGAFQRESDII